MPTGFEVERASHMPENITPHQCYLLTQKNLSDRPDVGREYVKQVHKIFVQKGIDTKLIELEDFFNIFEIMSCFRYLVEKHTNDQVIINVGGGSKLSAMAGMIISGMYEHVTCYYPKTKISLDANIEPEVELGLLLPRFEIDRFDKIYIPVLEYLEEKQFSTKKALLEHLIEISLIPQFMINDRKKIQRSQQSLFNHLKRNYVGPLIQKQVIEERDGLIMITKRGLQMLTIFNKHNFKVHK